MTAVLLPERIRGAVPEDSDDILRLIRDLAEYERDLAAVENTTALIDEALFGDDPVASALVAEVDGRVVGMAVWYRTYSTWTGFPGMYLEDLYVEPEHRGAGLGRALFQALARVAVAHGFARLEWAVLDWNAPAIRFYEALGGKPLSEWKTYRVAGDTLFELAR
ncbi:MAG TPA: GNAT family N-acetyltransferase [Nocardioides sp.]|nr:GNAT family N-acetyltransferase [Nocardioides sp.]